MRNDLHNLRHEALVRRNLRIPRLHILLQDDRQERVQLQIDVVAARQRREQFLDRPALVSGLLGAQRPPDEGLGGLVGEVVGHGAGGAAVRRGRRGGVRFRGRGWLGRRGRVRGRRGHLDRGPGRVRPRGGGGACHGGRRAGSMSPCHGPRDGAVEAEMLCAPCCRLRQRGVVMV